MMFPRFPVLPFPAMRFGSTFSSPAFSVAPAYCLDEKAKVIAAYYLEKTVAKKLVEDLNSCYRMVSSFMQQDGAPAYAARVTEDWLKSNCSDFTTNLPDLSPLDYHVWTFGGQCWSLAISWSQSRKYFPSWKTHWSGLLCSRNPSITLQWKTAVSDCRLVYQQAVDILNIKYDDQIKVTDSYV